MKHKGDAYIYGCGADQIYFDPARYFKSLPRRYKVISEIYLREFLEYEGYVSLTDALNIQQIYFRDNELWGEYWYNGHKLFDMDAYDGSRN